MSTAGYRLSTIICQIGVLMIKFQRGFRSEAPACSGLTRLIR